MDAPEDIGHMREYRDPWEDERISWDKQTFLVQNKFITSLIFRYRASCETAVRPPNISLVQNISWSWYSIITKIIEVEMREATLPCSVNRGRESESVNRGRERESVGTDLTNCSGFGTGRKSGEKSHEDKIWRLASAWNWIQFLKFPFRQKS